MPVKIGIHDCDKLPNECPRCHIGIAPSVVASSDISYPSEWGEQSQLQVVLKCPREECQELFIATYVNSFDLQSDTWTYDLKRVAPEAPESPSIPAEVHDLSQQFAAIYGQAAAAEAYGLDQIAGCGYRKAIEFLIKDYCISRNSERADEIKGISLGKCIADYVDGENVRDCARRATWLGNDETHYVRKWEEKDIRDLKTLIRLTIAWIENVLLTEQYKRDMEK